MQNIKHKNIDKTLLHKYQPTIQQKGPGTAAADW